MGNENVTDQVHPWTTVVTRLGVCPFICNNGSMGIGELRSHLFSYILARHTQLRGGRGVVVLRCDDTDPERCDLKYLPGIFKMLTEAVGFQIDVHPFNSEALFGYSTIQSRRTSCYQPFLDTLLKNRFAYQNPTSTAVFFDVTRFISECGPSISAKDIVAGELTFNLSEMAQGQRLGGGLDFPLFRSDGSVLWHFASTVDDFITGVNVVVRGKDKVGNVPFQEMIRIALDLPEKEYAHVPLLLSNIGAEGGPQTTFHDLLRVGFVASAIISYLCSSAYGDPEAIYGSLDDFALQFSPKRIHRNNGRFDLRRLQAINRHFIRAMSDGEYLSALEQFAEACADPDLASALRSDQPLRVLLSMERRDPLQSRTIAIALRTAHFTPIDKSTIDMARQLVLKMRGWDMFTVPATLTDIADDAGNRMMFSALRWILIGSTSGISWQLALQYFFQSGSLRNRLDEAEKALNDTHGSSMAFP